MTLLSAEVRAGVTLEVAAFAQLIDALKQRGYTLIGPTIRDDTLVYDEIDSADDLPVGYTDDQAPARFSIKQTGSPALFNYTVGQHSWKQFLYPSQVRLWKAARKGSGFQVSVDKDDENRKFAFIGVRSCELSAIAVQDHVFLHGRYAEPIYQGRRESTFVLAVNCGKCSPTCFCDSMKTGPLATTGFDIAITEVLDDSRHYMVASAGTPIGADVLSQLPAKPSTEAERQAAEAVPKAAASQQQRGIDTSDIKELLYSNYEHPEWEAVARRCLSCGNCTLVCPTCFCHTVEDSTDLTGNTAERWRKLDSCFNTDFSYIHGGSVRSSVMSRYRQWMTHKLATWIDQFGTSGCVGCGRCITWCPVGIDITEEVQAIRETPRGAKEATHVSG